MNKSFPTMPDDPSLVPDTDAILEAFARTGTGDGDRSIDVRHGAIRLIVEDSAPCRDLELNLIDQLDELGWVPVQSEIEESRIRMEIARGRIVDGAIERIARDGNDMILVLRRREGFLRLPLSGVCIREHLLLAVPGDHVDVMIRDVAGRPVPCGFVNHAMEP